MNFDNHLRFCRNVNIYHVYFLFERKELSQTPHTARSFSAEIFFARDEETKRKRYYSRDGRKERRGEEKYEDEGEKT